MKSKYKMTGCAKFLIFMIFFAPIAYFGASFINGEGGLDGLKEKFGNINIEMGDDKKVSSKNDDTADINALNKKIRKLNLDIQYLKGKLDDNNIEY